MTKEECIKKGEELANKGRRTLLMASYYFFAAEEYSNLLSTLARHWENISLPARGNINKSIKLFHNRRARNTLHSFLFKTNSITDEMLEKRQTSKVRGPIKKKLHDERVSSKISEGVAVYLTKNTYQLLDARKLLHKND